MKQFIATISVLSITVTLLVVGLAYSAEDSISATVTVEQIALSISSGTVTYGTLSLSGTEDTDNLTQTQTVTNDGNVNADFDIKGFNVTVGCTWTLAGTQDDEQYFHKWCTDTCDTPPTNYTALTTGYVALDTGVIPTGTTSVDLQIGVPSTTTCSDEATVEVYVQASAS